jgi:hypothetical protein
MLGTLRFAQPRLERLKAAAGNLAEADLGKVNQALR